jgi:hypothetical protein
MMLERHQADVASTQSVREKQSKEYNTGLVEDARTESEAPFLVRAFALMVIMPVAGVKKDRTMSLKFTS